jgi:hypothetical protein
MSSPAVEFTAEEIAELVTVASQSGYGRWREMVRSTGGCADPIHLVGESAMIDRASGEVLHSYRSTDEPNRHLLVACRNRRASRCPTCAEIYRADTYQLIRAGLAGGKDVPDTVSGHPRVFATLTAPSFGRVHHRVLDPDGTVQRCHPGAGCNQRHRADDPRIGQAVDPASYDYTGAVLWNALAGELWHRTITLVARHLARRLGLRESEFRRQARVSFGKVAEFQARGLVHFHVIIRLDGPDGPAQPPLEQLTVEALTAALEAACGQAVVISPNAKAARGAREVRWGDQLDIQPISAEGVGDGEITDQRVAGYVAKYATKAAENTGTLDRPVACWHCKGSGDDAKTNSGCSICHGRGTRHDDIHHLATNRHAQAMISSCWTLGAHSKLGPLRLRLWAHTLGYRGHFSTRSRRYSTTLGCLRRARQEWRNNRLVAALGYPQETQVQRPAECDIGEVRRPNTVDDETEEETILVVGQWHYIGRGYSPGEAIFARTIAHDLADNRRICRQLSHNDEFPGGRP